MRFLLLKPPLSSFLEQSWRSSKNKRGSEAQRATRSAKGSVCAAAIAAPFGVQNMSRAQDGEVQEREGVQPLPGCSLHEKRHSAASRWPEDFSCLKTGIHPLSILLTRYFVRRKHSDFQRPRKHENTSILIPTG